MSIRVDINVNDAAALLETAAYGAAAKVRLERAATEAGAYSEISTQTLVSGTNAYVFWDAGGSATSWYRSRVSDSAASSFSGYSDPFQVGELDTYASVEDLLELLPTTNVARDRNRLHDALVRATDIITSRCGRDFFRHPVSGTETRYFSTVATGRLIVVMGIVSLTEAAYASTEGGSYTALGAENTDWFLAPDPEPGDSFYEVWLSGQGSLASWYRGRRLAKLTGVFGYERIPGVIRGGTLALARSIAVESLSPSGAPRTDWEHQGALLPTEAYEAVRWGRRRITR